MFEVFFGRHPPEFPVIDVFPIACAGLDACCAPLCLEELESSWVAVRQAGVQGFLPNIAYYVTKSLGSLEQPGWVGRNVKEQWDLKGSRRTWTLEMFGLLVSCWFVSKVCLPTGLGGCQKHHPKQDLESVGSATQFWDFQMSVGMP